MGSLKQQLWAGKLGFFFWQRKIYVEQYHHAPIHLCGTVLRHGDNFNFYPFSIITCPCPISTLINSDNFSTNGCTFMKLAVDAMPFEYPSNHTPNFLTNSVQQSSWEADSHSAGQEMSCLWTNQNVHQNINKGKDWIILSHFNLIHTLTAIYNTNTETANTWDISNISTTKCFDPDSSGANRYLKNMHFS
jgi:hypothetical protein